MGASSKITRAVAMDDLLTLRRIGLMFLRASQELSNFIIESEDNKELIRDITSTGDVSASKEKFFDEVNNSFYAFSLSLTTLIDVTRKTMKKYQGEEFLVKFDEENGVIAETPEGMIVRQMRNFFIHGTELPMIASYNEFSSIVALALDTETFRVMLREKKDPFFGLDEFLSKAEERVYLSPVLNAYQTSMDKVWGNFLMNFRDYKNNL